MDIDYLRDAVEMLSMPLDPTLDCVQTFVTIPETEYFSKIREVESKYRRIATVVARQRSIGGGGGGSGAGGGGGSGTGKQLEASGS